MEDVGDSRDGNDTDQTPSEWPDPEYPISSENWSEGSWGHPERCARGRKKLCQNLARSQRATACSKGSACTFCHIRDGHETYRRPPRRGQGSGSMRSGTAATDSVNLDSAPVDEFFLGAATQSSMLEAGAASQIAAVSFMAWSSNPSDLADGCQSADASASGDPGVHTVPNGREEHDRSSDYDLWRHEHRARTEQTHFSARKGNRLFATALLAVVLLVLLFAWGWTNQPASGVLGSQHVRLGPDGEEGECTCNIKDVLAGHATSFLCGFDFAKGVPQECNGGILSALYELPYGVEASSRCGKVPGDEYILRLQPLLTQVRPFAPIENVSLAEMYQAVASCYHTLRNLPKALCLFEQSAEMCKQVGGRGARICEGGSLLYIGHIREFFFHDIEAAQSLYMSSEKAYLMAFGDEESVESQSRFAELKEAAALLRIQQGSETEARIMLDEVAKRRREEGQSEVELADTLLNLGIVHDHLAEHEVAAEYFDEFFKIRSAVEGVADDGAQCDAYTQGFHLWHCRNLHFRGHVEQAQRCLRKFAKLTATNHILLAAHASMCLGDISVATGEPLEDAVGWYNTSLDFLLRGGGTWAWMASIRLRRGLGSTVKLSCRQLCRWEASPGRTVEFRSHMLSRAM